MKIRTVIILFFACFLLLGVLFDSAMSDERVGRVTVISEGGYQDVRAGERTFPIPVDRGVRGQKRSHSLPEPSSLILLGLGLAAVGGYQALKFRKRSKAADRINL